MSDRRRRGLQRGAPAAGLACALALLLAAPAGAIVGGTAAPEGRWPWMAALLDAGETDAGWAQFCGGAVIAPRRVLTAGHCVIDRDASELDVLVGRTRLSTRSGRRIAVKAISVFPGYVSHATPSLDAAVLELREDAGVAPLALARPG
jgi:secreted trypsin-like serine protease